jgi:hypothetical protein
MEANLKRTIERIRNGLIAKGASTVVVHYVAYSCGYKDKSLNTDVHEEWTVSIWTGDTTKSDEQIFVKDTTVIGLMASAEHALQQQLTFERAHQETAVTA